MSRKAFAAAVMSAALLAFPAGASAEGKSATVKQCQAESQILVQQDGTPFSNVGGCVKYAAQGGLPVPPTPPEPRAAACQSVGGTFGEGNGPFWTQHGDFVLGGGLHADALWHCTWPAGSFYSYDHWMQSYMVVYYACTNSWGNAGSYYYRQMLGWTGRDEFVCLDWPA